MRGSARGPSPRRAARGGSRGRSRARSRLSCGSIGSRDSTGYQRLWRSIRSLTSSNDHAAAVPATARRTARRRRRTPRASSCQAASSRSSCLRLRLDLAQAEHVRERAARGGEEDVGAPAGSSGGGAGAGLPRRSKRAEILLERGPLAAVARRLRQHDPLTHDRLPLGLLHAPITAGGSASGRATGRARSGARARLGDSGSASGTGSLQTRLRSGSGSGSASGSGSFRLGFRPALARARSLAQAGFRLGLRARAPAGARARARARLRAPLGDRLHQLLLAATLLEALEVAPDRGAHVVEMALLAHGEAFPVAAATPSDDYAQRGAEGRDPDDLGPGVQDAARADERGAEVAEVRAEHVLAMPGRLEPGRDDVPGVTEPQGPT